MEGATEVAAASNSSQDLKCPETQVSNQTHSAESFKLNVEVVIRCTVTRQGTSVVGM